MSDKKNFDALDDNMRWKEFEVIIGLLPFSMLRVSQYLILT